MIIPYIYIYLSSIIFHLNQHVLPTKWCQTRDALKVAKHDCPKHQTLQFMPLTIIIIQLLQPIMIIPITILSHIQPVLSHVKTYYHTTSCPIFIHFYHMILLLLVINCPMIVGLNTHHFMINLQHPTDQQKIVHCWFKSYHFMVLYPYKVVPHS